MLLISLFVFGCIDPSPEFNKNNPLEEKYLAEFGVFVLFIKYTTSSKSKLISLILADLEATGFAAFINRLLTA